jgi:YD repeat-containing protein
MLGRLKIVGAIVAVIGFMGVMGGIFGYTQVQAGANALQGFSRAQNVTLAYDDQGRLVDRGDPEQGRVILALLRDTWGWPVVAGDLDPADPVVNTGTEYMYQMATIAHHTLDGTTQVTLTEPVAYDGDGDGTVAADAPAYTPETLPGDEAYLATLGTDATFAAGTYTVPTLGRYWTAFERTNPLDGKARELAWSGTVHGLFAELGVGATSFSALQMGQALALIAVAFGILFIITGLGLVWAASPQLAWSRRSAPQQAPIAV